jgi:hypothetical protein
VNALYGLVFLWPLMAIRTSVHGDPDFEFDTLSLNIDLIGIADIVAMAIFIAFNGGSLY